MFTLAHIAILISHVSGTDFLAVKSEEPTILQAAGTQTEWADICLGWTGHPFQSQ